MDQSDTRPHILVTPLNWGLGHATRCIPIIRELLSRNCKVSIGSDGEALSLLRMEFPHLSFYELPEYSITYSRYVPFMLHLIWQIPRILITIRQEHNVISQLVRDLNVNGIISDNRYGCWSRSVKSVFITHQLNIQMPWYFQWIQPLIRYFNFRFIKKFSACWIPDDPSLHLSGLLTESNNGYGQFIGFLSRFSKSSNTISSLKYKVMFLVSGPEPQRTLFETACVAQIASLSGIVVLVRGLPSGGSALNVPKGVEVFNHLPSNELQQKIKESEWIVCRSGYSTLMDLIALGKEKVIVIPTPGQTEQEYLANRLQDKKITIQQFQSRLQLGPVLKSEHSFAGFASWNPSSNLLAETIDQWLKK